MRTRSSLEGEGLLVGRVLRDEETHPDRVEHLVRHDELLTVPVQLQQRKSTTQMAEQMEVSGVGPSADPIANSRGADLRDR